MGYHAARDTTPHGIPLERMLSSLRFASVRASTLARACASVGLAVITAHLAQRRLRSDAHGALPCVRFTALCGVEQSVIAWIARRFEARCFARTQRRQHGRPFTDGLFTNHGGTHEYSRHSLPSSARTHPLPRRCRSSCSRVGPSQRPKGCIVLQDAALCCNMLSCSRARPQRRPNGRVRRTETDTATGIETEIRWH